MKKKLGQSSLEFALMTAVVFGALLATIYAFSDELSKYFSSNNPAKTYNQKRMEKHENPSDLVTSTTLTVGGLPVSSPVETVLKANLASGFYDKVSGSTVRGAEVAMILNEYTTQLINVVTTMPNTAQKTTFLTAVNAYRAYTSVAVSRINAAGNDRLAIKAAVMQLATEIYPLATVVSALKTAETNYLLSLSASNKKTVIQLYTDDMLALAGTLDYNADMPVYNQVLSVNKNNTITQDYSLSVTMNANMGSYSANDKSFFNKKMDVNGSNNYSETVPHSYNNDELCSYLGGSGSPCNI